MEELHWPLKASRRPIQIAFSLHALSFSFSWRRLAKTYES